MNITRKKVVCVLMALLILVPVVAQKTGVQDVYHYTLDNGLELFIAENSNVPLTYIELAVKGGGISQTEETVGLFHLYEHMIFKGNTKFPTAAAVQKAINDMGVPSWNGSTANEYVNYFFTVPSDLTYEGLEFWSYAVREPLLDENEFENEKKVVIAELEGGYSEPSRIFYNALYNFGFPDSPWQFDPGGTVENITNSTLEELIKMKDTYYVPNNTALFVGGDVKHEEVLKMVNEIYGDWERAVDPWENKDYLVANEEFKNQEYLVYPNEQVSPAIAQVSIFFRGPDGESDLDSTYAADIYLTAAANPESNFIHTITSIEELLIPTSDYVSTGFLTSRHGSIMSFTAALLAPESNIVDRAFLFSDTITDTISTSIINDEQYFTQEQYASAKQRLKDSQIYERQTPQGLLSTLRFFWTATNSEYYFNYLDNLDKVEPSDISELFETYINDKNSIVMVSLNPNIYNAQKADFEKAGFITVTDDNAFWWK